MRESGHYNAGNTKYVNMQTQVALQALRGPQLWTNAPSSKYGLQAEEGFFFLPLV